MSRTSALILGCLVCLAGSGCASLASSGATPFVPPNQGEVSRPQAALRGTEDFARSSRPASGTTGLKSDDVNDLRESNIDGKKPSNFAHVTWQLKEQAVPHVVSPEAPLAVLLPLSRLWELYRTFRFQEVIELARDEVASGELNLYEAASAHILAAASAYLTNQRDLANQILREAVRADRHAIPDPQYFPTAFCGLYWRATNATAPRIGKE